MPNRINTKKPTLRHTTVKLVKTKGKEAILKTDWGKGHIKYKETNIKTISDSSLEIMRAKRQWNDIFKENKDFQSRILCLAKIPIKMRMK